MQPVVEITPEEDQALRTRHIEMLKNSHTEWLIRQAEHNEQERMKKEIEKCPIYQAEMKAKKEAELAEYKVWKDNKRNEIFAITDNKKRKTEMKEKNYIFTKEELAKEKIKPKAIRF